MMLEKILLQYWKYIKAKDTSRLALQNEPQDINVIIDIPYIDKATQSNMLDIYYPKHITKPMPVIIMVHGGGWLYGDKELNKIYAMNLALRGFSVVNINYHLAHEKRFPEQIKEIFSVFNWIENNYKQYELDINNIFITGDSAGAHLSSICMALLHNPDLQKELGVSTCINIKAGGMICGVFDIKAFKGVARFVSNRYGGVILGKSIKKSPYNKYMSLKSVYRDKIAPLYLMSSRHDFVREQTLEIARYCKDNGIEHVLRYWEEGKSEHLFHVFNVCYPLKKQSIITNDEMCEFFRKYIVD